MAKKEIRTQIITDDIDGSELAEGKPSIRFSLDGIAYEIDLSEKNESKLRDALAPFVAAATTVRAGTARGTKPSKPSSADAERLAAIRAWATENGIEVGAVGRIAKSVVEAYDAAN